MQDFRPNEDHLSNFRSALQYMIMQHSNSNGSVYLFPAWPCDQWSIAFKLHVRANNGGRGCFAKQGRFAVDCRRSC